MKKSVFRVIAVLLSLHSAVSAQDDELPTRNITYAEANPRRQRQRW